MQEVERDLLRMASIFSMKQEPKLSGASEWGGSEIRKMRLV